MRRRLRLAVLISGGGRTLLNIADRITAGALAASIELVISSRREAPGVERAAARGLDVRVVERGDYAGEQAMHDAIDRLLEERPIDLVCMAGYLRWMRVGKSWERRVINIHPALLPEFGGPGMYGLRVHRAVLAAGRTVSGCTVHYVDGIYDHGPIILQRTCPVLPGDDPHTLAARVFLEECIAYPEAIALLAAKKEPGSLSPRTSL